MALDELYGFGWLIQEKIRDLVLDADAELKAMYIGEVAGIPIRLHPWALVFSPTEQEAEGEDGYVQDTGPTTRLRYHGYVTVAVAVKDVAALVPGDDRKANSPSYQECALRTQRALTAVRAWGDPYGDLQGVGHVLVSTDGKERTVELRLGTIRHSLGEREEGSVTDEGSFDWIVTTKKEEYP